MATRRLLLALFLLLFSMNRLISQTVAVGHVTAEVVEAVSASSFVSTDFSLGTNSDIVNGSDLESAMISNNISIGKIEISAGEGIACNLTIKADRVTDKNGNNFSLEPTASCNGQQDAQQIQGTQTIELAGQAILASNQASGSYSGSYTLVFAYN